MLLPIRRTCVTRVSASCLEMSVSIHQPSAAVEPEAVGGADKGLVERHEWPSGW